MEQAIVDGQSCVVDNQLWHKSGWIQKTGEKKIKRIEFFFYFTPPLFFYIFIFVYLFSLKYFFSISFWYSLRNKYFCQTGSLDVLSYID